MNAARGPQQWMSKLLSSGSSSEKQRSLGVLFMVWWMILKKGILEFFNTITNQLIKLLLVQLDLQFFSQESES
jgi:hypothetical protein